MTQGKYIPSNSKTVTILGIKYQSLDEVCRDLGIGSSMASAKARREFPGDDQKEERIKRKDEIIIEEAKIRLSILHMKRDFAAGKITQRRLRAENETRLHYAIEDLLHA